MIREPFIAKKVGEEKFFRWRGEEVTRIEGFTDAVMAFAVTLLVVSLEVPETFDELLATMRNFLAFGVCFALLIVLWYQHFIYFRRYGLQDGPTVVLNSLYLFVILFYVYPLKFLFTQLVGPNWELFGGNGAASEAIRNEQWPQLMLIFSAGYIAVSAVLALMYWRAARLEVLDLDDKEKFLTLSSMRAHLLNGAVGVLSAIVALATGSGSLAGLVYLLLWAVPVVHGRISASRFEARFGVKPR